MACTVTLLGLIVHPNIDRPIAATLNSLNGSGAVTHEYLQSGNMNFRYMLEAKVHRQNKHTNKFR